MNKSQFYLSQCADAASKSTMYYTLGSVIVKGGKVISTGFNHQRPNYDTPGNNGRPVSMHAEMASIFNATRGAAPALKQQVKPGKCTATPTTTQRQRTGGKAAKQKGRQAVPGGGRSRCPKLNGCDLYVCRTTKNDGTKFGCSKPCWRCIDWCAWAGIRRIFHWSAEEGRFICLKVKDASPAECYETTADVRLLARAPLL
ncbi:hypothetical protein DFH08DRAFT_774071 [Mycena albidolilacea]|uniref:CMP/dCMP-type deaminase domain-containing protein n=1 Tax=Mycena albidolilacea TaxID=1033008 RepID=A0AAD7EXF9_9AGAR|nr:hypothetical protein DFH08DRAFT_774071 [Mycena albidolilacea]